MVFLKLVAVALISSLTVDGLKLSNPFFGRKFMRNSLDAVKMNENKHVNNFAAGLLAFGFFVPSASWGIGIEYKLPPIDRSDENRCVLTSSAMGQANAARDKLYDLRECDLKGQSGAGKDMSGMIGSNADFSGVDFKEAQISKYEILNGGNTNALHPIILFSDIVSLLI